MMKNMQKMMKQAQEMQERLAAMQEEMEKKDIEGQAGGGMVKVTLSGKGEARAIQIDNSLLKADEKDVLEDLIVAAINDAKRKTEEAFSDQMGSMTGGMQLPEGFKLPF